MHAIRRTDHDLRVSSSFRYLDTHVRTHGKQVSCERWPNRTFLHWDRLWADTVSLWTTTAEGTESVFSDSAEVLTPLVVLLECFTRYALAMKLVYFRTAFIVPLPPIGWPYPKIERRANILRIREVYRHKPRESGSCRWIQGCLFYSCGY